MRYVEEVLGRRNIRFWHCEFGIMNNEHCIYIRADDGERLPIPITKEKLNTIVNDCLIQNGLLCKNITFLENDNGDLEPFYSDSQEVKEALREVLVPKRELSVGNRVQFFNIELFSRINGEDPAHIIYLGRFMNPSNKKEHAFVVRHNGTNVVRKIYSVQSLPQLLNVEEGIVGEELNREIEALINHTNSLGQRTNYFRPIE